ncbi:uncharacterized protein LOC126750097 [Anthonomus grandis grandis]|uniref:uncharacterized protein LOC126750097 n=1 Tax=Anthonomus grandis grandis TaxID=2921223 RepID=UPI0021654F92|nr:uncharacterized protein LOC126750097 [Anthonomus grandis grandis]
MFHVYWPMLAFVTLIFVVGAIMGIFKWGPKLCKLRHTTLPESENWRIKTYEQSI